MTAQSRGSQVVLPLLHAGVRGRPRRGRIANRAGGSYAPAFWCESDSQQGQGARMISRSGLTFLVAFIFMNVLLVGMAYMTWYERKCSPPCKDPDRPNRTGPRGCCSP